MTASAMLAELYRRDPRGFILDRHPADKLILICRFAAILMACILKCKGIPARARSGQAGYWSNADTPDETSDDHWINPRS